MRQRPLVSTMIVMRDGATTILPAIESVRAQTLADIECVVVDDGSTDGSTEIVRRVASEDPRVRLVQTEPRGVSAARNRALDEARGTFLHFLDADDLITPVALATLVRGADLTAHGCACAGWEMIDERGVPLDRQTPVRSPWVGLDELLEFNCLKTNAHLFSRRALGSVRFDESVEVAEDYDLVLRMAVRGVRWRCVDRIVASYRVSHAGLSKRFTDMARWHDWVLSWAFNEARARGWASRGIDLSGEREARSVSGGVLLQATMDALVADPERTPEAGDRVIASRGLRLRATPEQLGAVACTAIPMALGIAPEPDGAGAVAWMASLERWWTRCVREGWVDGQTDERAVDRAWASLAERSLHPDRVAERVIARGANGSRCALVAGMDATGRRLARMAAASGLSVVAIDPSIDRDEGAMLERADRLEVEPPTEEAIAWLARSARPCVLVGSGREAMAMELTRGLDRDVVVERWDEARGALCAERVARVLEGVGAMRERARVGAA